MQDRFRGVVRRLIEQEYKDQKAAAKALGVSQSYVSEFMSGGRGGGAKILGGLAVVHPELLAEVFGLDERASQPYSTKDRAIVLMVADGRGSFEDLKRAAQQAQEALSADESQSELAWVEMITPFSRAH